MTKAKVMRKVWWFDPSQIEEAESWLAEMAERGWHLSSIGTVFATFRKGQPGLVRYRCEVAKGRGFDLKDRISFYATSGWEYIGGLQGLLLIFRARDDISPEIHTDPTEQALTLAPLRRHYFWQAFVALVLCGILTIPYALSGGGNLWLGLVLNGGIDFFLLFSFILGYMAWITLGLVQVQKMMGRLRNGLPLTHSKGFRGIVLLKPVLVFLTVGVLLLSAVNIPRNLNSATRFLPLPPGTLPVVRISELVPYAQIYPLEFSSEYVSGANKYRASSSLLVPRQWYFSEFARVQSGYESYDSSMVSFVFEARSHWLAMKLGGRLISRAPYRPDSYNSKPILVDSPLDAMWMYHNGNLYEIVAVQEKYVYHVYYNGRESYETLVALIKEKLESLESRIPAGGEKAWKGRVERCLMSGQYVGSGGWMSGRLRKWNHGCQIWQPMVGT